MQVSWLFPDGVDRERMLDMDRRLRPVRRTAFAVLAAALLASGPWLGWWTLLPLGCALILFRLADPFVERSARPEFALFAAWTASQVIIAVSVAICGGPTVPTLSWLALPMITLSARFSERGTALGVGITLILLFAVAFGVDAGAVIDNPPLLFSPLALIVTTAIMQTVMMRSDVEIRAAAVIDPLTGMLNRKALATRAAELTEQSRVSGEPIGVIVGDLDNFKVINDNFGHAAGDAVLRDVAYALRKATRAFDLVYRIGGEEFLVLVPGADEAQTRALAEQLRAAVAARPLGDGHAMTMSFGCSASASGAAFDYDRQFAAADAALYEAKRDGRDRVRGTPGVALPV